MAADTKESARDRHKGRIALFQAEVEQLTGRANRLSLVNLLLFLVALILLIAGVAQASGLQLGLGVGLGVLFVAGWLYQAHVLGRRDQAQVRVDVHRRHLARLTGQWLQFQTASGGLLAQGHPYAHDIDLVGPGSLFQRIDTTHTLAGQMRLATWLGSPAELEDARARQVAVRELADLGELRQELEVAVEVASGADKLNHQPFVEFTKLPAYVLARPWLVAVAHVLPVLHLGAWAAVYFLGQPLLLGFGALGLSFLLAVVTGRSCKHALDLVAARRGFVEAFVGLLVTAERAKFEAPLLRRIQERLSPAGEPPSVYMARLDRWAGYADLHTNFLLHLVVNPVLLWDLHVLLRLERWSAALGKHAEDLFDALGDLEAAASLATLLDGDSGARMPELSEQGAFEAKGLAHPLLLPEVRVANDVSVPGPGHALIVTGSNMAGKSTLLRSVGVNVALAWAGGPVCAERFVIPAVRLRASMRAQDDLQRGASYFLAELNKLRTVVEGLGDGAPVFFLLDELLRGTNARARHVGARAVLEHLLDGSAMGIVATHDVALAALEEERAGTVQNAHFTDVVIDDEMTFDYKLRDGVVRTSNALRLLRMAGIQVADE